jgi:hypothetical protein
MPATRKNRLKNPLRQLRLILGDGETPLDQEHFANRIGVSVATLRSMESGRRPVSDHVWIQIFILLSARWDHRKQGWHVLDSDVPYEKKYAVFADSLDPEDAYVDDYSLHRLIERLLTIFKACPSREYRRGLLMYLFQHLQETAEEFGLRADLKPTEPVWTQTRNPKPWGKPLGKEAVFWAVYPHSPNAISPHLDEGGIFDFRSWRTFRADDYPEGKENGMVQKQTADKQPKPQKEEILSAPIAHPNVENEKIVLEMELSEEP